MFQQLGRGLIARYGRRGRDFRLAKLYVVERLQVEGESALRAVQRSRAAHNNIFEIGKLAAGQRGFKRSIGGQIGSPKSVVREAFRICAALVGIERVIAVADVLRGRTRASWVANRTRRLKASITRSWVTPAGGATSVSLASWDWAGAADAAKAPAPSAAATPPPRKCRRLGPWGVFSLCVLPSIALFPIIRLKQRSGIHHGNRRPSLDCGEKKAQTTLTSY